MLARKYASDDPMRMCGGKNVSPQLAWTNAPEKTKSFAIFMFDPDGREGLSVSHWVAYGIPATVTSLAEGEAAKDSTKFIGGKGTRGNALYIGPCPPAGDAPHHYLFTVVATDLDPHALKPGMTREERIRGARRSRAGRRQHRRQVRAMSATGKVPRGEAAYSKIGVRRTPGRFSDKLRDRKK